MRWACLELSHTNYRRSACSDVEMDAGREGGLGGILISHMGKGDGMFEVSEEAMKLSIVEEVPPNLPCSIKDYGSVCISEPKSAPDIDRAAEFRSLRLGGVE